MLTLNKRYIGLLLLIIAFASCSKQKGFGPNYDDYNPGLYPVSVDNAVDYRPDPTVTAKLSGDSAITITLSLQGNSSRSIKEITKVATSTSYTAIQSAGTTGFYPVAAIPVGGKTVTFKTSISTYLSVYKTEKPAANAELVNRFYFRITLDDGTIIYPTPVRVLIVS
ncbi:MAG: hypothetical protein JST68_23575 [Bacteroidetes bacterium]|nr:hypothetical protein [Bacteroidota bacterium]